MASLNLFLWPQVEVNDSNEWCVGGILLFLPGEDTLRVNYDLITVLHTFSILTKCANKMNVFFCSIIQTMS